MITESATIVGLLGRYMTEKAGADQLEVNDFVEWLAESNHIERKQLLKPRIKLQLHD